jgi:hypothetical protein
MTPRAAASASTGCACSSRRGHNLSLSRRVHPDAPFFFSTTRSPAVLFKIVTQRPLPRAGSNPLQVIKGINPRRMPVRPHRLDGISAHHFEARQLKRLRRQWFLRIPVNVAHNIHLALAPGAGAGTSQFFQRYKILAAIVPFDRQLAAYRLNVHGSHMLNLSPAPLVRPLIPEGSDPVVTPGRRLEIGAWRRPHKIKSQFPVHSPQQMCTMRLRIL